MLNNKGKRNFWFVIAIVADILLVWRLVDVISGQKEWWQLLSIAVIVLFSSKFYLCYRKQVKQGNLNGRVNPLAKD